MMTIKEKCNNLLTDGIRLQKYYYTLQAAATSVSFTFIQLQQSIFSTSNVLQFC